MLQISFMDPDNEARLTILENDRGDWEVQPFVEETGCVHLVGFGGENVITVHFMPMQDGTTSVVVVSSVCDNPLVVKQGLAPRRMRFEEDYYTQTAILINRLLAEICDYPEQLEAM